MRLGSAVLRPGSSLFSPHRRQQPPITTTLLCPGLPKSLNWPQGHPQGQGLLDLCFGAARKLSFEELAPSRSTTLPSAPQLPLVASVFGGSLHWQGARWV